MNAMATRAFDHASPIVARAPRAQRTSHAHAATRPHSAAGDHRRALNLVVAAVGLIAVAPLMLVIAALIKLTSRGPVIYRQPRIGIDRRSPYLPDGNSRRHRNLGGAPFVMYKFRTMRPDASTGQVWARQGDSRVTAIGRILRKVRLDELPQLVNVLRGEMNVVGPRPEQPEIAARLRELIGGYAWRHRVLPGITGWAQINRCYDRTIDDVRQKVAFDLEYIDQCSAREDARIMLSTLPVMLGQKGGW